ncbi:MAG TPA: flavin reductase [Terriglobales bacterium]|nr:flavin reductase [Terriglobales bacterium]
MNKTPKELTQNFFRMIDDEWMLVTARKPDGTFNMYTASWGGVGVLWNKPVTFIFVRESRYTAEFLDAAESYTLSFFDEDMRGALNEIGAKSGRELDKMNYPGLTPVEKDGAVTFKEAKLTLSCKKLYRHLLSESDILCPDVLKDAYPQGNFHIAFVGEITECTER